METTFQLICAHIKMELLLFRKLWKQIIPTMILLYYFGMIVGRVFAFVRHRPGEVLKDIGFELFPKKDYAVYSDVVLGVEHLLVIVVCMLNIIKTVKNGHTKDSDFGINIWRRYLNVISIGHLLRILTYLSTSLPGSADHCKVGSPEYNPPQHWYQAFYKLDGFGIPDNCGDLIFSGHMLQMMVAMLCFNKYADNVMTKKISMSLKILSWLLIPLEAFFIISSRNHYTVDITVAIYVSVLLWIVYNTHIQSKDLWILPKINSESYSDSSSNFSSIIINH